MMKVGEDIEMERINENVIKVLIGVKDLEERGVNFLDLMGDQSRIEKFFYSILEEVDTERQFQDSDTVTFQVIPNSDGLELYISSSTFDEMDTFWEQEITRHLRERRKAMDKRPSKTESVEIEEEKEEIESQEEVVVFNELNDFLRMTHELPVTDIQSSLYFMNDRYYLVLGDIPEGMSEDEAYHHFIEMLEFGDAQYTTEAVLREYAELIREDDALEFFSKL